MKGPAMFILLIVFAMVSSVLITSVISKTFYMAAEKKPSPSEETVWEKTAPVQPVIHGMTVQR
jgi:hypothetical protein